MKYDARIQTSIILLVKNCISVSGTFQFDISLKNVLLSFSMNPHAPIETLQYMTLSYCDSNLFYEWLIFFSFSCAVTRHVRFEANCKFHKCNFPMMDHDINNNYNNNNYNYSTNLYTGIYTSTSNAVISFLIKLNGKMGKGPNLKENLY